ncbi:hypothetical protein HNY73_004120 [Argiope bruennichi]|uniref:Uncharacterized protein n=1 Tax=Argiope bruennichi TaxID=94029 RepID=A0A8T0FNT1_ARGBR|nr:hypothetical protein HNY73_004120 [Argiope bruennichi]
MLWDLETLGIKDETEMSVTDRKLLVQFNRDLEFKDGRHEAKLLWRTDPRELENNFNLAMRRFDELKKKVIKHHIAKFEALRPNLVSILKSGLYVDDLYFGADSVMEAFALSSDDVPILRSGGFKLRKLRSNNSDLRALWVKNGFRESEGGVELKLLGLNWNLDKDVWSLEVKRLVDSLGNFGNTKRCVV